MRPDEFSRQMAGRWTRIEHVQTAWNRGKQRAETTARRNDEIKRKDEQLHKDLLKQHGV